MSLVNFNCWYTVVQAEQENSWLLFVLSTINLWCFCCCFIRLTSLLGLRWRLTTTGSTSLATSLLFNPVLPFDSSSSLKLFSTAGDKCGWISFVAVGVRWFLKAVKAFSLKLLPADLCLLLSGRLSGMLLMSTVMLITLVPTSKCLSTLVKDWVIEMSSALCPHLISVELFQHQVVLAPVQCAPHSVCRSHLFPVDIVRPVTFSK